MLLFAKMATSSLPFRRVKEDVLSQLPAKIRGIVLLDSQLITMEEQAKVKAKRIQNDKLNVSSFVSLSTSEGSHVSLLGQ